MPEIRPFIEGMQLLVTTGTFIGMIYAFYKFARTPESTQNERITALENWQKQIEIRINQERQDVERRFSQGNEHFSNIDEGTTVTQNAILAIMDTLLNNGDNKDELKKRRDELYSYLTAKK